METFIFLITKAISFCCIVTLIYFISPTSAKSREDTDGWL